MVSFDAGISTSNKVDDEELFGGAETCFVLRLVGRRELRMFGLNSATQLLMKETMLHFLWFSLDDLEVYGTFESLKLKFFFEFHDVRLFDFKLFGVEDKKCVNFHLDTQKRLIVWNLFDLWGLERLLKT